MMKLLKSIKAVLVKINSYNDSNAGRYKYREYGSSINPSSGLPMVGGLDVNGNSFGSSGSNHHR
jgi:hypothetical protein